jgi:hypothetical protein
MTRKEDALLEMLKGKVVAAELENLRGDSIYEQKIACEKLKLLTGKDYSYLVPEEEVSPFGNKFQLKITLPGNSSKSFIVYGDTKEECIGKARDERERLIEERLAKNY